jgi:uncharacterized protein YlxW (UPF0749 family)
MSRYKSNFDYSKELRELRTYSMDLSRKLANEQALTMELTNQIADYKQAHDELQDELNLAHEALRRAFKP